jgi:hypothetical protein
MDPGSWRWRRSESVLYREALDDVVLLVPGPEAEPFALAGGVHLWRLLEQPHTTGELATALAEEEAVPRANQELAALLAQLADSGAVERVPT